MNKYQLKIPATSANLGPGFDCLAIALNLYNSFTATAADSFSVDYQGPFASALKNPADNLVISSYQKTCHKYGWEVKPFLLQGEINIPLKSGLGSSATAVIAGICFAYLFNQKKIDRQELLNDAYLLESHTDNIVAAIFGGLTSGFESDQKIISNSTKIDEDLKCLIIYPHYPVSTEESRLSLPETITLKTASANLARATTLVSSIITKNYQLLNDSMLDSFHEPYRMKKSLNLPALKKELLGEHFYGWSISGSGPSILIFCDQHADRLKNIIHAYFGKFSLKIDVFDLLIDNNGLVYSNL